MTKKYGYWYSVIDANYNLKNMSCKMNKTFIQIGLPEGKRGLTKPPTDKISYIPVRTDNPTPIIIKQRKHHHNTNRNTKYSDTIFLPP
jgi:hypothetical protein